MRIDEVVFAGKNCNDKNKCLQILKESTSLPICALYTQYEQLSYPKLWFTVQGVSLTIKLSFDNQIEMAEYLQTLDYSKKSEPLKHKQVFDKISEIAIDRCRQV